MKKSYVITDFSNAVSVGYGVGCGEVIRSGFGIKELQKLDKKLLETKNGVFYFEDKRMYKVVDEKFTPIVNEIMNEPVYFSFLDYGNEKVTFAGDKNVGIIFAYGTTSLSQKGYPLMTAYNGCFFFAEERTVYILDDYDQTNNYVTFPERDEIILPSKYGVIKKLVATNEGLYVLCEKGAYIITYYGNLTETTVKDAGNHFNYNVTGNSLKGITYFSGGKFKSLKGDLDGFSKLNLTVEKLDEYGETFIAVTKDDKGGKYLYIYSGYDSELLSLNGYDYVGDGFVFDSRRNRLGKLEKGEKIFSLKKNFSIELKPVSFSNKEVTLLGVEVYGKFLDIKVSVTSEFGRAETRLSKGGKINLKGNRFSVTLTGSSPIEINGIKFIYKE